jgi:hypothetical protein
MSSWNYTSRTTYVECKAPTKNVANYILQMLIDELQQYIKEEETRKQEKIDDQQEIISQLRQKCKEFDNLKTFNDKLARIFKEKAMAEQERRATHASEIEELQRDLDVQKGKLKLLQADYDEQKGKLEGLRADYDSAQLQLQEVEKELSAKAEKIRLDQTRIANDDETIKTLEVEITENKKKIKDLDTALRDRNSQLRAKDRDIQDKETEIGDLKSRNEELMQLNENFESEKEKVKQHIKTLKAEIEELRSESRDRDRLEAVLAEAKVSAAELQEDFTSLEQQNSELRATIEYLNNKETGSGSTHKSLQSELAEFDNGNQSDEEGSPIPTKDPNKPEDSEPLFKTPGSTLESQNTEKSGLSSNAEHSQMTEESVSSGSAVQPQNAEESETSGSSAKPQEPAESSQEDVGKREKMEQNGNESSKVIEVRYIDAPPVLIFEKHNPIACWVRVYLDLWILLKMFFVVWFDQPPIKSFGRRISVSSSRTIIQNNTAVQNSTTSSSTNLEGVASASTLQAEPDEGVYASDAVVEGEPTDPSMSAAASQSVAPVVAIDVTIPADLVEPKALPSLLWTITALCFHLMFYAALCLCYLNYQERSIWLTANEVTRQYLHDFYQVPSHYGLFHRLFDNTPWLAVGRYNIHHWTQVSLALPG